MSLARIIFVLLALIVVDPAIGMRLINPLHDEVDNRIIGGQDAYLGQFPHQDLPTGVTPDFLEYIAFWFVLCLWRNPHRSLLGPYYTAGHCIEPTTATDFTYVITAGQIQRSQVEPTEQIRYSTNGFTHPFFFGTTLTLLLGFDVGLIRIEQPFEVTYFVDKICYAPENYYVHHYTNTGVISGWGRNNISSTNLPAILQWEQVQVNSDATCVLAFPVNYDILQYICVGEEGHTSCGGDSGGPLTTEDARIPDVGHPNLNNKMVSGITSKGSAACDTYGVYTRVAHYSQWIELKTGIPPCQISY